MEKAFADRGGQIAAVIVEPVVGNMGCVPPAPGFLEALRELTARHGSLLIFDEVMTGFRVALGGAQQRFGIQPDLTTLGKIIGGGLPMAAYGGRADIMQQDRAAGAGVSGRNAIGESAGGGRGTRDAAASDRASGDLRHAGSSRGAVDGVDASRRHGESRRLDVHVLLLTEPVTDWESAKKCDTARFGKFFHFLLERGVYIAPSQFEAGFVSAAHTEEDIRATVNAAREFFESA